MISTKFIGREDREAQAFAKIAAAYFNEHPDKWTFTVKDVQTDEWFAVKWAAPTGSKVVSVLVFRLPHGAVLIGDLDIGTD